MLTYDECCVNSIKISKRVVMQMLFAFQSLSVASFEAVARLSRSIPKAKTFRRSNGNPKK